MKFKKKPIIIDAIQWNDNWSDLNEIGKYSSFKIENGQLTILTLEGEMKCSIGDWIIRGIKGELYPCKPDIFEKIYEAAE